MRKKLSSLIVLLIVICFILNACTGYREKKLNESFTAFNETYDYLTINQFMLNDIPAAEIYADNGEVKPLVIIIHGVMSCKEDMLDNAKIYADNNYHVIVLDAAAQGDRANKYMMFPEMVVETAKDLNDIIRYYSTVDNVDATKVGLVGFSMGSFVSYWYVAYGDYPISAVIAEVGTPDFTLITPQSSLNLRYKGIEVKSGNWSDEKFANYMANNNPMSEYQRFDTVAVMMLNGKIDDLIPYTGCENLYNYLKNVEGSKVEYYLYTQSGHLNLPYDEIKPMELRFMKENLY